ncbi:MAG TPA: tetratricopeptide repeat protein, partial [Planctomycetes bacterium]|nr:tetratricopeptide repeat protein [Planctomycetota bacterium]
MKTLFLVSILVFPQASPPDPAALERKAVELETQGKFAEAVPLLKKALQLREKKLGPGDQLVGRTLYSLSYALSRAGRHGEALEAGRRALAIARRAGDPSPGTAMTRRNLAEICEKAGLFAEARKLAERAVEDFEKVS